MAKLVMRVVDEPLPPAAKVVVSMHGPGRPVLAGGGRTTLLCGACGAVVAKRIDVEAVRGLVLQCPDCCRYDTTS